MHTILTQNMQDSALLISQRMYAHCGLLEGLQRHWYQLPDDGVI